MSAQHMPRYLGGLAVDKRTRSNERRRLTLIFSKAQKIKNPFFLVPPAPLVHHFTVALLHIVASYDRLRSAGLELWTFAKRGLCE